MHLVTSLYGSLLLLALIAYGLLWMTAPGLRRDFGQRLLVSFLLFLASNMIAPNGESGLVSGSIRLLLSLLCFLCSVAALLSEGVTTAVRDQILAGCGGVILMAFVVVLLPNVNKLPLIVLVSAVCIFGLIRDR